MGPLGLDAAILAAALASVGRVALVLAAVGAVPVLIGIAWVRVRWWGS